MVSEKSLANLKKFTTENAAGNGAKGGAASGVTRRRKKELSDVAKAYLDEKITNKKGETATRREIVVLSLIQQAMSGNVKAVQLLARIVKELPPEKVEQEHTITGSEKGNKPVVIRFVDAGDDGCQQQEDGVDQDQ